MSLEIVWYDAKKDVLFQSGMLEGMFCALVLPPEWWRENPHIEIIGLVNEGF